ncbi:MAG: hypothetical protein A3J83_01940 [Elusimicrobia bacterium RIFOXYA2_FULL_40_6]|nr:MAG: hypothetical protein A3J83_01940 [Elusimicrobia bacterium RIFOXYA2_FULL_40_6]
MLKKIVIVIFSVITAACFVFSEEIKLREYIDIALANNPELIAFQNNYISAKFKFWEARSMYFPQVSANMSASRRVSPLSATFGDTSLFPGLPEKTDVTTYSQGLSAQQNIWDFGKTGSIVSRAGISRDLNYLSYEKKKQEIIYNVKKSYYNLMQAITIQNLASFNLKEVENLYKSVQEREKEGLATPIDVLNIESQYVKFKADVETAKHNVEIAMLSFTNILGKELTDSVIINEGNFPLPADNPLNFKNYDECKEQAAVSRLDFQELALQEKLAEKDVKAAYSEWLPSLSANGSYDLQGNTYPPNLDSWSAAVNLSVPIFKGGADYAKVKSAGAGLASARQNIKQMKQNIFIQIKSNYYKATEQKQNFDATDKKRQYLERNFDATNAKFKEGLASLTDLIEAQTKKSNGEIEVQQALFSYHIALNDLEYSTGGIR